ncbi:MAG: MFS transporter [Acidocella sp.]|nr:MFS transporter [Acidocella sp.]
MAGIFMSDGDAADIAARLDRLPRSWVIWKMIILASTGGVFEFYDLFLTGYIAPDMARSGIFSHANIGIFATLQGIAVSGVGTFVFCTFAGMWVGLVIFSQFADWFGRRTVFTWSLLWYVGCTAIMAFQPTGQAMNIWRFIAGIGFSVQLVTIDAYISEMIPKGERGRAFAANQFITFCVVPVTALLAWLFSARQIAGFDGWRWVILIGSTGAFAVWALRAGLPESPRWLALHGMMGEANAVMDDIERRVIAETRQALPAPERVMPEKAGTGHFYEIFAPRYFERTVMLSIFNMAQVIGFYGFAAWVPTLLVARGIALPNSLEYSFIIAIANPLGPVLGMFIADRVERKFQILFGLTMMGVFMALFSISKSPDILVVFGVLFSICATVMSYAYHSYQTELYPTRIRARAAGFVYAWSRIAAAFAGLAIGYFLHAGGVPAVAVFISIAVIVGMVMISVFGPRTSARALEEINH